MNHLPSIEEFAEIKRLIVEKDPNDEDKFLRKLWHLASQGQEAHTSNHALGEMILEWVEKSKRSVEYEEQVIQEHSVGLRNEIGGYNSALTHLQTFIKSEVIGKE